MALRESQARVWEASVPDRTPRCVMRNGSILRAPRTLCRRQMLNRARRSRERWRGGECQVRGSARLPVEIFRITSALFCISKQLEGETVTASMTWRNPIQYHFSNDPRWRDCLRHCLLLLKMYFYGISSVFPDCVFFIVVNLWNRQLGYIDDNKMNDNNAHYSYEIPRKTLNVLFWH